MNKDPFAIRLESKGVVRLSGRLDASQAGKAKAFLEPFSEPLVLDFTDLDYISSAGVGTCLGALEDIQARGGSLTLAGLKENVRHVFELLGFLKIVVEHPTAAAALAKVPPQ